MCRPVEVFGRDLFVELSQVSTGLERVAGVFGVVPIARMWACDCMHVGMPAPSIK